MGRDCLTRLMPQNGDSPRLGNLVAGSIVVKRGRVRRSDRLGDDRPVTLGHIVADLNGGFGVADYFERASMKHRALHRFEIVGSEKFRHGNSAKYSEMGRSDRSRNRRGCRCRVDVLYTDLRVMKITPCKSCVGWVVALGSRLRYIENQSGVGDAGL